MGPTILEHPAGRAMEKGSLMGSSSHRSPWLTRTLRIVGACMLTTLLVSRTGTAQKSAGDANAEFAATVKPLLKQYCLVCHSTKVKKGSLDLERFAALHPGQSHGEAQPFANDVGGGVGVERARAALGLAAVDLAGERGGSEVSPFRP